MICRIPSVVLLVASMLAVAGAELPESARSHPDTSGPGWQPLFATDFSDAIRPGGVWSFSEDGVLTATEDKNLWTKAAFSDCVIDLEFKTADGTNSGVIVYCSDTKKWIPNSVEIQIADDHNEKWAGMHPSWQCAAFFGHKAAEENGVVKKPGEWNRYTITCQGQKIWVLLNGRLINSIDLAEFTSAKVAPDGTEIPKWLNKPWADLPTSGSIGLQGKHAGAPVWFRNLKVKRVSASPSAE